MRKAKLAFMVMILLMLTGCIKEYDYSVQQSDAAAEYMAGLLLKYDKNYEPTLLSEEDYVKIEDNYYSDDKDQAATPSPVPDLSDKEESRENKTEVKQDMNYTLAEVIGADGIDVQYSGYQLYEVYPEGTTNAYFSLTPREGNQLLVASFHVENKKEEEQKLNLSKSKILYQLDINVGTIYKPLLTLLENDLQYIDITLKAGTSKTLLLIFEVSKDIDMSDINLIISLNNKTEIIDIK